MKPNQSQRFILKLKGLDLKRKLNAQLTLLFAEAIPHPQLEPVRQLAGQLSRSWRSLWARFGDAPEGRVHFRAAMERFADGVRIPAQPLQLRNELGWYSAMVTTVAKFAVRDASAASADEYGPADLA